MPLLRLMSATLLLFVSVQPAGASEIVAKEAARGANCQPGKVEVLRTVSGRSPEIIYKVECTGMKDRFLLVRCTGRLCTVLR